MFAEYRGEDEKMSIPRDIREIANAILDEAEKQSLQISNLSLNKIAYFAHAWFLASYSKPLVDSFFEAWEYGPVHPQIYRQMKKHGDKPITSRLTRIDFSTGEDIIFEVNLPDDILDHVRRITRFYGHRSASWLVGATHEVGAPWDQVWLLAKKRPNPGMPIPDDLTEAFYREKLKKKV